MGFAAALAGEGDVPPRAADAGRRERRRGRRADPPAGDGGGRGGEGILGQASSAAQQQRGRAAFLGGELEAAGRGHRHAPCLADHRGEPAVAQPLLHHRQHILVAAAFGVEDALRLQPGAGKAGREQVAAGERPQHRPRPPRRQRSEEQGRRRFVGQAVAQRRRLVQRGDGEAAVGEAAVDIVDPEGQDGAFAAARRRFERPHRRAQRRQPFGMSGVGVHRDSTLAFHLCSDAACEESSRAGRHIASGAGRSRCEPLKRIEVSTNAIQAAAPARPIEARSKRPWQPLRLGQQPFFADKNRAFWILQSVGWAGYFLLRTLSGIANSMGWSFILHAALLTATGYSITLLMGAIYRRLIRLRPIFTWAVSILIVLLASGIFSAIETWSFATFLRPGFRPEGVQFFSSILLTFSLLVAWSALYYSINYYLLLEEQSDRLLRLESQASHAQLAMLRYQLNPHFLFNTLNSISTLVLLKQTEQANAMLSRLSSFLRYTLVNEPTAQVTVAQEVETLKLYLEIEKMRFEDRLRPKFRIEAAAAGARLPSLLLQPLVENAIKYAVTPQEEGADIEVAARRVGDRVIIEVNDTGPGSEDVWVKAQQSTGVGLANIRDRLSQAYGADHRFETESNKQGGFGVTIDIPYQSEPSEEPK